MPADELRAAARRRARHRQRQRARALRRLGPAGGARRARRRGWPRDGVECQRIPIDIAAHSRMLEPILGRFGAYLRVDPARARRRSRSSRTAPAASSPTPRRPIPDYWVGHLRGTVRFADGISHARRRSRDRVYLEVGPGKALSSLAQAHGAVPAQPGAERRCATPTSASPTTPTSSASLGRLWAVGVASTGSRSGAARGAPRVPLPTYAFQRRRYFIEPGAGAGRRRRAPADARATTSPTGAGDRSGGRGSPTARSTSRPSSTAARRRPGWCSSTTAGVGAAARRRGCARPATAWSRSIRATPSAAPARTATSWRPSAAATATTRWSATSSRAARCRPAIAHLWLVTDRETLPPGLELLPPQPGARLLHAAVPRPGAGRREPADAARIYRRHLGRGAGARRAAALPREGDGRSARCG